MIDKTIRDLMVVTMYSTNDTYDAHLILLRESTPKYRDGEFNDEWERLRLQWLADGRPGWIDEVGDIVD